MKYLTYTDKEMSIAFKKSKAFFAFNQKQLEKGKKENKIKKDTILVNIGAGLICPEENVSILKKELSNSQENGIKRDIKENGKKNIIIRELNNYESFYSNDITDVVIELEKYGITEKEILSIYKQK